jgi:repressor LexA
MFADSTVQELIPVDSKYISKGSKYFILETSGDSMNNVGINNGDFVLCKKNYHPTEGDIVIALIGDDATIKEFHREKNAIILKPQSSNPKHTPLRFEEGEEIVIQGVFVRVLRKNNES